MGQEISDKKKKILEVIFNEYVKEEGLELQNDTFFNTFLSDISEESEKPIIQLALADYYCRVGEIEKAKYHFHECGTLIKRNPIPRIFTCREKDDYTSNIPIMQYYELFVGTERYLQTGINIYASSRHQEDLEITDSLYRLVLLTNFSKLRGRVSKERSFYSFRTINLYSISDIITNSITVCHPSEMNDPLDSLILPFLKDEGNIYELVEEFFAGNDKNWIEREKKKCRSRLRAHENYRIRSFSVKKNSLTNTLMWAHYANNHRGMAVEYSFDDEFKYNISESSAQIITNVTYAQKGKKINLLTNTLNDPEIAYLTKSNDWKYENEVRLLYYDKNNNSHFHQIPLKGKIKAIYFGLRCSPQDIDTVYKLIQGQNIPCYKMEIDTSNVYSLKYHRINRSCCSIIA